MIAAHIVRREGCSCPVNDGRSLTPSRTSRQTDLTRTTPPLEFGAASAAPRPPEVFVARAEARALLCAAGELSLHEAVDEQQLASSSDGLVAKIGLDEIERIMAADFAHLRDGEASDIRSATNCGIGLDVETFRDTPGRRKTARDYHANPPSPPDRQTIERARHLLDDNASLERALPEIHSSESRAASSTLEALVYSLRAGGTALGCSHARTRPAELSEAQLHEVSARLQRFKPHIARAWTPIEVEMLVAIWFELHG